MTNPCACGVTCRAPGLTLKRFLLTTLGDQKKSCVCSTVVVKVIPPGARSQETLSSIVYEHGKIPFAGRTVVQEYLDSQLFSCLGMLTAY